MSQTDTITMEITKRCVYAWKLIHIWHGRGHG